MLDPVHDSCGVAAVYLMGDWPRDRDPELLSLEENASNMIPGMLTYLQNRGQLAAGITSYNPRRNQILDTWKDNGTVAEVFRTAHRGKNAALMREYAGQAAIGHTRYATCGLDDASYAQPFERHHGLLWKWFAFCFNGNIANFSECHKTLTKNRYHLVRETDTELLMHHLCLGLEGDVKPNFVSVFRHIYETFDGAYCLAFITADGDLIVARDPHGFRPLCYAVKDNLFAAASESHPLVELGLEDIQNVEPGTFIHVRPDGWKIRRFADSPRKSYCFFEWVYFSNAASVINGKSVYLSRRNTGEELARLETETIDDDCIVVPVPDTARAAADAMAHKLGIPCFEGLFRNRYLGRTFIEGQSRREKVRLKYAVIPEVIEGKRVFLVEDSIVRSTTLREIISMIRQRGGAKEVHVRVACPPIMAPCSYGIDMSTVGELFAPRFLSRPTRKPLSETLLKRLADDLQADSLRYLPVDSLARCIGLPEEDLCVGCVTGEYPTKWGRKHYQRALKDREGDRAGAHGGQRTYEKMR